MSLQHAEFHEIGPVTNVIRKILSHANRFLYLLITDNLPLCAKLKIYVLYLFLKKYAHTIFLFKKI